MTKTKNMPRRSLRKLCWWAVYAGVASRLPSWWRPAKRFRTACARRFAPGIDRTANINRGARIGWDVVIGPHGGVGEGSTLSGEVTLGPHVTMGPECRFITGDHPVPPDYGRFRDMKPRHAPITVGEDVFLGAGVTILPGVTIGPGAAIGAGSVVAKDIPAGAVAVGNPAKVIRTRLV